MEPKHRHTRVLVIDDDEDLSALVELVLSRHGMEVYLAWTGQQGLQSCEELHPDLVILDCMLPGMNGWEVFNRLRAIGDFPVIVHTAMSDVASEKRWRDIGAADYLTKPQHPRELAARVAAVIEAHFPTTVP
jgi:DNA-binding response OmpR family regulator